MDIRNVPWFLRKIAANTKNLKEIEWTPVDRTAGLGAHACTKPRECTRHTGDA